jgi:hypothetical protein
MVKSGPDDGQILNSTGKQNMAPREAGACLINATANLTLAGAWWRFYQG